MVNESRFVTLQNTLEQVMGRLQVDSSACTNKDYAGFHLLSEGYEHITYPGTAHVRQYLAFSNGILKLNIIMGEEDSRIESTQLSTPAQFIRFLQDQSEQVVKKVEGILQKVKT